MIHRTLTETLRKRASQYPVVTLTGPRQLGKTTLVRSAFPEHAYASLEDPELRAYATSDARGFLRQFSGPVILDEAQRVPDLFSYIQILADEEDRPGRFILSGSQNFLLLRSISQSLAGRTAVLHLLPFSLAELSGRSPFPQEKFGRELPALALGPRVELPDQPPTAPPPELRQTADQEPEALLPRYRAPLLPPAHPIPR